MKGSALYINYSHACNGKAFDGTDLKKFWELDHPRQLAWQYAAVSLLETYRSSY